MTLLNFFGILVKDFMLTCVCSAIVHFMSVSSSSQQIVKRVLCDKRLIDG